MTRPWIATAFVSLVFAVFAVSFPIMGWVRHNQGHEGHVYPSQIEKLAIRHPPTDPLADARDRGRNVYEHYCQICHGEQGKGAGFNSTNLEQSPRDFTDKKFWQETSDERAYYAVAEGGRSVGKSVLMPAWGHTLSDNQIRDVIVFIRAFAGKVRGSE